MNDNACFERLLATRRLVCPNKRDGAPFSRLIDKLAKTQGKGMLLLAEALCVQMFGVRNMVPCNCCEARYKMHGNNIDGTRIQIMYPFFDCISLYVNLSDGTELTVGDGCCGNCLWLVGVDRDSGLP